VCDLGADVTRPALPRCAGVQGGTGFDARRRELAGARLPVRGRLPHHLREREGRSGASGACDTYGQGCRFLELGVRAASGATYACAPLQGPYCFDVDGNKYIDYIGSWGPAIVGAANDEVNAALHTQIDKGTSFGAPCELEVRPWELTSTLCRGVVPVVCL
jgi:Aminotransferase class-III